MLSLVVSLVVTFPTARAAQFGCQRHLAVAHLAARDPIDYTDGEMERGLPGGNALAPLERAKPGVATGGYVLHSDLGLALWDSEAALNHWLHLGTIIADPRLAQRAVLEIASTGDFCPRGLTPAFCRALRDSYQQMLRLMKGSRPDPDAPPDSKRFVISDPKYMDVARRGDLYHFFWAIDPIGRDVSVSPTSAQRMLQTMARESLISRLLFVSHDHQWRLGAESDFESRLAVALRPAAVSLLPLLTFEPPTLQSHGGIGNRQGLGRIMLVKRRFKAPAVGHDLEYKVSLNLAAPFAQSIQVEIAKANFGDPDTKTAAEVANYFDHLLWRLAETLKTSALRNRSVRLSISPRNKAGSWRELARAVTVGVEGMDPLPTILLLYELADHLEI